MGYTHYWRIPSTTSWCRTWPQLVHDTRLIVQVAGVRLAKGGALAEDDEEPQIDDKLICLNGHEDGGHETFVLEPKKTSFECCKTARKEYDVVVAAVLLRASQLAGEAIRVSSDGDWDDDWEEARGLVNKLWPSEEITCPWVDEEDDF